MRRGFPGLRELAALAQFSRLALVAAVFGWADPAAAETTLLRTVAEIRAVEQWTLRETYPVALVGTVTLVDPERRMIVLQDATGAIAVNVDGETGEVKTGQSVAIDAANARPTLAAIPDFPFRPSGRELLTSFEAPANQGINYVSRFRGYLHPPVAGNYRFWITSDDTSELWLSTDSQPQSARRIAAVTSWTQPREWNHLPSQNSADIPLEAGRRYYIEAVHEQHGGVDHLSVFWSGPELPQQVIAGTFLEPWEHADKAQIPIASVAPSVTTGRILREYWRDRNAENAPALTAPAQLGSTLLLEGSRIRPSATRPFPVARRLQPGQRCSPDDDYRWCEMEGTAEFVAQTADGLALELNDGMATTRVVVKSSAAELPRRLQGRRVRVQGVGESALAENGESVIGTVWVPTASGLTVIEEWPQFDSYRAATISELRETSPELLRNRPVKLRGRVASTDHGQLTLSDSGAFYGYTSPDGKTWKKMGGPVELPLSNTVAAGLVVNSRSAKSSATAVFSHVEGLTETPELTEIGGPSRPGELKRKGGQYIVSGSGHDIWARPDQFYFVHRTLTGAGELIAHVASFDPPLGWAKAGLMMRDGLSPDAPFVDLVITGDHGCLMQWRKAGEGSAPLSVDDPTMHAPQWLKLARRFNTIQVSTASAAATRPGTLLEVVGYAAVDDGQLSIADAAWRELSPEVERPPPLSQSRPLVELSKIHSVSGAADLFDLLKVRGVVTFSGSVAGRRYLAIQDQSAASFVSDYTVPGAQQVRVGQMIEVHSNPGWTAPSPGLTADSVVVLGPAVLPKALRHPAEYALPKRGEASWIEVQGVVRSVSENGLMQLKDNGEMFTVAVNGASPESLRSQIDATLRLRGAIAYPAEQERLLLVPSADFIEIVDTPPRQVFDLPSQPFVDLAPGKLRDQSGHRVKVKGVVSLVERGFFYVQDDSAGARIEPVEAIALQIGDLVEAAGFPDFEDDQSVTLANALVRVVGSAVPPTPIDVTAEQLRKTRYGARLIRITATFSHDRVSENDHTLELQLDQRTIRASIDATALPSIPPGSIVGITGVCVPEPGLSDWITASAAAASILPVRLLLRSPADLVILQKPRWWAVQRTLLFVGIAALGTAVSAIWIRLLHRRVAQRSEQLRAAMEKLQLETQAAATLAERNRLAGEIHDSLEQGFSGLIFQLDTTAKLRTCPPDVKAGLTLARNMVAFSRNEVRHAVWDLHSPILENSDLSAALHQIVRQIAPDAAHLAIAVEGEARPLASAVEHHLLRIVQEAITNSLKHAGAKHLDVVLRFSPANVTITVRDDGCGFVPEQVLTGGLGHFGLRSLRSRARKIQGDLTITSTPGQGTVVTVQVPSATPSS